MSRKKMGYDQLADAVSRLLSQRGPQECDTIEEAQARDEALAERLGMEPPTLAEYEYCPTCGKPMWQQSCRICDA